LAVQKGPLKNAGHWIMEEQGAETIAALNRFL